MSNFTQNNIIECFIDNTSVRLSAEKLGLHKNTIHLYYKKLRNLIIHHSTHYFYNRHTIIESFTNSQNKKLMFGIGTVDDRISVISLSKLNLINRQKEIKPQFIVYSNNQNITRTKISNLELLKLQTNEDFNSSVNIITFWSIIKDQIKNNNLIQDHHLYDLLKEYEWRNNLSKHTQHVYLKNWANIENIEYIECKALDIA
ncbi:hypothetical protein OAO18_01620 [Francisellaceae bacterium]|nr:hypothetical protein [Francisellaceae bacterium]